MGWGGGLIERRGGGLITESERQRGGLLETGA